MKTQVTPLKELDKFMGGALQERVVLAIFDIIGNIFDINIELDVVRKVIIELTIKPSKSRREAAVTTKVTAKLAPLKELETVAQIGMDESTGELVMVEQSDIPDGQINIDGETHENKIARFPSAVAK